MKTLYTAFKGKNNTSCQLSSSLRGDTLLLTNSFQGLERDILGMAGEYERVIMLGVDKNLKGAIRLETCAEYNGEMLFSAFCMESLAGKCGELMIPYQISRKPAGYLCNAAFWHMLRKIPNTVFVHIPSTRGMSGEFMEALTKLLM